MALLLCRECSECRDAGSSKKAESKWNDEARSRRRRRVALKSDHFSLVKFIQLLIFILQYLKYYKSSTNSIILKRKPKDRAAFIL
jgi:hypothetical protein